MFLKTLEMQGFKSFPDKTVISFDKGITAIVGPNGSGKSNISDAIRWVMGEMSPKSLRGGKMEDIIFNGTARRKKAGFAEVVMTLDNTDGTIAGGFDEVSVARRLYRTGESEYYLNKNRVRLKDVVDLFLNTGIGREGYSVIGQGKIAEIISAKNDERRGIFEEAAGISRFRYRKNEAENKLVRTRDNLLRLNDILREIEGRLPGLEKQSARASEYIVLAAKKKGIEVALWLEKLNNLNTETKKISDSFEKQGILLTEATRRLDDLEKELEGIYIETQRSTLESNRIAEELGIKQKMLGELSGRLAVSENNKERATRELENLLSEQEKDEGEAKELLLRRDEAQREKEEKEKELNGVGERELNLEKTRDEAAEKLEKAYSEEGELREEERRLLEEKSKSELSRMESESFNKLRLERLNELNSEKEAINEKLRLEEKEKERLENSLDSLELDLMDCSSKEEKALEEKDSLSRELDELSADRHKKRLSLLEVKQRIDMLKRMDRVFEGFSGSVKSVMNAANENRLFGIFGPVSKLFEVEDKYIVAIETALGGAMQNIAVSNEESAKNAIAFLKRTNAGRATFLPLTTIKPRYAEDKSFLREKGCVGIASEVISCEEKFRPILDSLLARTIIAENIDFASDIAKKVSYKLKIVTLDGQVINAGGSFTGGQQLRSTGILSRGADIARLEKEAEQLEKEAQAIEEEIREGESKLEGQKKITLEFGEKRETLAREINDIKTGLFLSAGRHKELTDRLMSVEAEAAGVEKSNLDTGMLLSELDNKVLKINERLTFLGDELQKKNTFINKCIVEKETAVSEISSLLVEKSRLSGEVVRMSERYDAICEKIRERNLSGEQKKERVKMLTVEVEASSTAIDETGEMIERTNLEISESQQKRQSILEKITALEKRSTEKRALQKKENDNKENVLRLYTQLKSRLGEQAGVVDSICAKLWEEYELTPESASEYIKENPVDLTDGVGLNKMLSDLKNRIRALGNVNLDSIEEYKTEKERFDFLSGQFKDVENAERELVKLIASLEKTMCGLFGDTVAKIQKTFKKTFVELFGGGNAEIVLTDEDDILNCGIDINIQPPGKVVKSLSLLSGGEQAFVAIALYFAILQVTPSPFCIFDEIEAALDEANVTRLGEYLRNYSDKTQFIVITHRRGTMEAAETLYGITMQEKGVSDFIRVSMESAAENNMVE